MTETLFDIPSTIHRVADLASLARPWLTSSASTVATVLGVMALLALVEAIAPLRARARWGTRHLTPNLALTFMTFATNLAVNAVIVAALAQAQTSGIGILNRVDVAPVWSALIVIVSLDLAFYVAHVAMHKVPAFWRVHSIHHSDPAVDVTTSIRQHPLEGFIRYSFIAMAALLLGASPAAFTLYVSGSALNALFEHANIQLPLWLDRVMSWITTWPYMHKVHHSRRHAETDSNYGNLFSIWDRIFFTFTPSRRGSDVSYGLDGCNNLKSQTLAALIAAPFRRTERKIRE